MVLPNVPGYSETFFNSLINGLIQNGNEVIGFARNRDRVVTAYPVFEPFTVTGNSILDSIKVIFVTIWLSLSSPIITRRYFELLKDDEIKGVHSLKLLYLNAHILTKSVDWLYFGFDTMAKGREQIAKAIGAKMAVSIRGYDIAISPLGKMGYYDLVWKYLDRLHYLSNDLLTKAYILGLPKQKEPFKITPAIDVKEFREKERKYFKNDKIRIITVARLHWKKGLDYALLAMRRLLDKGMDFSYSIVGTGKEYEKLCFMINDLGLRDRVNLTGKKTHNEVKKLLLEHDIFLMPSVQEGFCNAALEAQASGLICIVSDAEGLPENVVDNVTGYVVPRRNPEILAYKIMDVLQLPMTKINKIRKLARDRVEKNFNLENHLDQWEKFFTIF